LASGKILQIQDGEILMLKVLSSIAEPYNFDAAPVPQKCCAFGSAGQFFL
jgi:hypothetical protein